MTDKEIMQQALEVMGTVGADHICEASHHAKKDRHKLGEPCPLQQRWHIAYQALFERLAQPVQEPVAWVYPEGLEALESGKPWTAYSGDGSGPNPDGVQRIPLYLHPVPERAPELEQEWVTFNAYGEEDDVWYENPEGKLPEGWTYKPLYDAAPQPRQLQGLTPREIELIDGMIEVQLHHAKQCDRIGNRTMAEKQKGWDMERVALLQKLRERGI